MYTKKYKIQKFPFIFKNTFDCYTHSYDATSFGLAVHFRGAENEWDIDK